MLEKVRRNNAYYYLLPRAYRLYKGLSDLNRVTKIGNYEWYGLSIQTAETYGHIYIYSNLVPVMLFAMDERSNIELLLRNARLQEREDVIEALKETFILYDTEDNVVVRNSEDKYDKIIAEFLCKNGYEGYGSDEMPKGLNSSDMFHSEICVCNADKVIVYQNEKIVTEKAHTSFINKQPLGKKAHTRVNEQRRNNVVRDLFGFEERTPKRRVVSRSLFVDVQEQEGQEEEGEQGEEREQGQEGDEEQGDEEQGEEGDEEKEEQGEEEDEEQGEQGEEEEGFYQSDLEEEEDQEDEEEDQEDYFEQNINRNLFGAGKIENEMLF